MPAITRLFLRTGILYLVLTMLLCPRILPYRGND